MAFDIKISKPILVGIGVVIVAALIVGSGLIGHYAFPYNPDEDTSNTVTTTMPTTTTPKPPTKPTNFPLPKSLVPTHYAVKLIPFINGNFSISGHVIVDMDVKANTSNITIHMADIITHNSTIKVQSTTSNGTVENINITRHTYDASKEWYVGHLAKKLSPGNKVSMSMEFTGLLNDQLRGFYRSSYQDENDKPVMLATTQFQPTDARRAFPCFDEPALKAQFTISLARQSNMSTLSNMPISSTENITSMPGWVWDHYNTSVKMSTYLVAFVVSNFANTSTMAGETEFNVWARPAAIHQANYSATIGPQTLTFFEEYFNITYPLPKQDMVAIPDFASGAMENWGLITYRETALLYDPKISAASNKQRVGVVVVHELAHQWFGNLVTPSWWTDLWLNEGFASYMEYVGLEEVEPEWKMMEQFLVEDLHSVMAIDSLETSHAISIPVGHPDEINEIFDAISYSKGAAIIRMMQHFLTEENFKKGLSNYLKHFSYGTAEQDDLWEFLTNATNNGDLPSGATVKSIMDTWTLKMGYPVVYVNRSANGTMATLTQSRFLLVPKENSTDNEKYKWWIPISFTSSINPNFNQTKPTSWMSVNETSITLTGLPNNESWVIFNNMETGYYRVNYDENNWNLIIAQLIANHSKIHVTNRAQLLDDAMALARAGHIPYETALGVYDYLANETEYVPWKAGLTGLDYMKKMMSRSSAYGPLKQYMLNLLIPFYKTVGFEDKSRSANDHLTQYKRTLAVSWACQLEHEDCKAKAVQAFNKWNTSGEISPNLRTTIFCTAIAEGGEQVWNLAWERYLSSNVATEKDQILSALGCSKEIWILSRFLEWTFTAGKGIRKQDIRTAFRKVARNDIGNTLAWNYLRNNWEHIAKYSGAFTTLADLVTYVSEKFNTKQQLRELEIFHEQHKDNLGTATRAIEQAVESTGNNVAWMTENYENITQWLEDNGYTDPKTPVAKLSDFRLPTSLVPTHYKVELMPFINGDFSISGRIVVDIRVVEKTSNITIHLADIITKNDTIKVQLKGTPVENVNISSHTYDPKREWYVGHLEKELSPGDNITLEMHFIGLLNDQLRGFYRSSYQRASGERVMLAATQFQPTDARRAFPCFDEPALKAKFSVSLARQTNMTTISNMPIDNTAPIANMSGWVWDHYKTTVPMSTYLVAFIVSDFKKNENMAGNTIFMVWTRPEALQQAEYASEIGPKTLTFFEEYFKIPYPLPKQDMVAIPDFAAGAMENWGLIIYRESAMLYEPTLSSATNKQWVGSVIVHELAHQWFGNLVTPSWWTDLWLNEGFATYMEYVGLEQVEPKWKMMEQFLVEDLHRVMAIDSLETSHPISIPVGHPDEINEIFDGISYSKGASIIRMMQHFLGETTFKKGLTKYLNAYSYKEAEQDNLWEYLTNASAQGDLPCSATVKDVMDTWTLQMGYPVLTVNRSLDGKSATLKQSRFLLTTTGNSNDTHNYMWWIPITYSTAVKPNFNNTKPQLWMSSNLTEITIDEFPDKDNWVILNNMETGYYRVNYDAENWNLIISQLETDHKKIHVTNRAQLIDDSMALARAGHLSYDIAMNLTSYLSGESEYIPWSAALNSLQYLDRMMTRTAGYGSFKSYVLQLLVPFYDMVGFEDRTTDDHLTQFKRSLAVSWACYLEHSNCTTKAVIAFEDWAKSRMKVSPNLRTTIFCTAIAEGGITVWDQAWQRYLTSNVATEKDQILSALGCSKQIWILSRFLDWTFTEGSGIRKQDARTAFRSVARNDVGNHLAWNYLRNNWKHISDYSGTFTTLGDMISYVSEKFNTEAQKQELEMFYEQNKDELGTASRALQQAIESVGNNAAWISSNYANITHWLENRPEPPNNNLTDFRLPTSLVPTHYEVKLMPFINGNYSIAGHVVVNIDVVKNTSNITIHMADIELHNETIMVEVRDTGKEINIISHTYDPAREWYVGILERELAAGEKIALEMRFTGLLNDQLRGFYRSSYKDDSNNTVMLAATQFQPTDARRAFPCFDEPALKATFNISLARERNMSTLSNMPKRTTENITDMPEWVWDHYEMTERMSTYLVAFIVSDFESKENLTNNTEFNVWARPSALDQTNYSAIIGPKTLLFFEEYFNISYPLPKLDMIAIPDFAAGAMENWGLIIYRETAMLYDPEVSSASDKQWVALVIVHELAHQWFGNLVTPSWWTDLWLNEGFATYMEYVGLEEVEPTWNMMEQFLVADLHQVMAIDSLESSHRISIPVGHPDEINEIFDTISYSKGASVIRMMVHFLTEETFKKGLTNYLNHFSFNVSEQDNLWEFLTNATLSGDLPTSVKDIMDTWTLQMGFPVITVTRSQNGTSAIVKQNRFLLINNTNSLDSGNYSWWVPITYSTKVNPDFEKTKPEKWISKNETEIQISNLPGKDKWVIFNNMQTGYYRVNYDDENWDLIIDQLQNNHTIIHVTNRAQLLDDTMALARAGLLSYVVALNTSKYLINEEEYVPLRAGLNSLQYLEKMLTRTSGYGRLSRYIRSIVDPLYDNVGFDDNMTDAHLEQLTRSLAVSWACHLNHKNCTTRAVQAFNSWPHNSMAVSANLRSTIICTAIAEGGEEEWDKAWQRYRSSNVGAEKDHILSALGCSKDIWILRRFLEWTFTEGSGIRKQDARTAFRAVARNAVGNQLAWTYLKANWNHISEYFGTFTTLGDLITYVAEEFNTVEQKQELEMFYEQHKAKLGTATRALQQAIESTANNIAWMKENYETITNWLQNN